MVHYGGLRRAHRLAFPAAPNRFRPALQNQYPPARRQVLIDCPFDVHRLAIVSLDELADSSQFDCLFINNALIAGSFRRTVVLLDTLGLKIGGKVAFLG